MTVDPAWEAVHKARAWGQYPDTALVEFVARHYGLGAGDRRARALDIGCGAGASTLFLAREGFSVTAVDASRSALDRVAHATDRWLGPAVILVHADMAEYRGEEEAFDLIADVCCLSCLPLREASAVVARARTWLKPGGRMLMVTAADDCDPAVHGEFDVHVTTSGQILAMFRDFGAMWVGKRTRETRRGFVSEWVVEVRK